MVEERQERLGEKTNARYHSQRRATAGKERRRRGEVERQESTHPLRGLSGVAAESSRGLVGGGGWVSGRWKYATPKVPCRASAPVRRQRWSRQRWWRKKAAAEPEGAHVFSAQWQSQGHPRRQLGALQTRGRGPAVAASATRPGTHPQWTDRRVRGSGALPRAKKNGGCGRTGRRRGAQLGRLRLVAQVHALGGLRWEGAQIRLSGTALGDRRPLPLPRRSPARFPTSHPPGHRQDQAGVLGPGDPDLRSAE